MTEENRKERKKEFKINFVIESGTEMFEIDHVEGKLNAIIIDSREKISFSIWSKMGYLIYHTSEHIGIEYYAPRVVLRGQKLIHFDLDMYDKFKLNEPLEIRIDGPKGSEVRVILRID